MFNILSAAFPSTSFICPYWVGKLLRRQSPKAKDFSRPSSGAEQSLPVAAPYPVGLLTD